MAGRPGLRDGRHLRLEANGGRSYSVGVWVKDVTSINPNGYDQLVILPYTVTVPAPTVSNAVSSTDGSKVTVTFSKAMAAPPSGSAGFSVTVNGATSDAVTANALESTTTKLDLTLATPLQYGQTVTLSYTPGSVQSTDGGVLAAFSQAVTNNVVFITSLTASPASPQAVNTQITWTCVATGGTSLRYEFWTELGSNGWQVAQVYGTGDTFAWKPTVAGSYSVGVWVKDVNSTNPNGYDQLVILPYTVTSVAPVAISSFTPNKTSPQAVNTQITWTCVATGGTSLRYEFWTELGLNGWQVAQVYGTGDTFAWKPTVAGSYSVGVWVKDVNSTNPNGYDQLVILPYTVTSVAPVAISSFTPNKTSPQAVNTQITWTCLASGGTSLRYEFWTELGLNGWQVAQVYGTGDTFAWKPTVAGSYSVGVWVKDVNSTNPNGYDQLVILPYTVTSVAPVAISSFTPNKTSPQAVNTQITWTCVASGGTSLRYEFWTELGLNGWQVAQVYGTGDTFAWKPTVAGSYSVGVWVKDVNSTNPNGYDQLVILPYTIQ